MSKRAFFVIGSEGSGTYMLAEAFVSAGCIYCDKDNIEEFLAEQQPDLLVLRRSLPHAGAWPDLDSIMKILRLHEYHPQVLGIFRDQKAAESSAINRGGGLDYLSAMIVLPKFVLEYDSYARVISYEYFVLSSNYRKHLFADYGLPEPQMEFYDGNAKYYE